MVFNGKLWQFLKQLFICTQPPTSNYFLALLTCFQKKQWLPSAFLVSPLSLHPNSKAIWNNWNNGSEMMEELSTVLGYITGNAMSINNFLLYRHLSSTFPIQTTPIPCPHPISPLNIRNGFSFTQIQNYALSTTV